MSIPDFNDARKLCILSARKHRTCANEDMHADKRVPAHMRIPWTVHGLLSPSALGGQIAVGARERHRWLRAAEELQAPRPF